VVQYHFIPAYRDGGVAVPGKPEFAYNFNGYQFWFSTQDNRERFIQDPWKYAPAWGGFCSWGVALERSPQWPWQIDFLGPPASPWEGWAVVDGVLLFNIWDGYTTMFLGNAQKNMRLAAERWKGLFGKLQAGPFNTHCIGHGALKNWCLAKQPSPWLQELPECITTATTNETTIVTGGGIVSQLDDFEDFDNSSISPWQKRWTIAGAVLGPVFVLSILPQEL
jgi:YHS domain-containing protein